MPARAKRQRLTPSQSDGPAPKVARTPAAAASAPTTTATLVDGWERAVLPHQPTSGHSNACWAPPVVALARFYRVAALPAASLSDRRWTDGAGGSEITVESVLSLRPGDEAEEACEVFEDIAGCWLPETTFGDDEAFIKSMSEASDAPEVVWGGPTSVTEYGVHAVADAWWESLTRTLSGSGDDPANPILLLVERLEGGKDKGNTLYLLVFGFEEQVRRRGGNVRKLWLKDPMVHLAPPSLLPTHARALPLTHTRATTFRACMAGGKRAARGRVLG